MSNRVLLIALCVAILAGAAWLGRAGQEPKRADGGWTVVAPGVLRSPGPVAGYALVDGDKALLIDAPCSVEGLAAHQVRDVEGIVLTHYHRPAVAALPGFRGRYPVRAPKAAAEWLSPDAVRKYWKESLPL